MRERTAEHPPPPPHRGLLDATLVLLLLYAVWSRTPCGALPVFALRAYQGLPTPDLIATFRGRETSVHIDTPLAKQGLLAAQGLTSSVLDAANATGTDPALLLSFVTAEPGGCRGSACVVEAPPRLADVLPDTMGRGEVDLLDLARAIAAARARVGSDELGLEALYVGVATVERVVAQASASALEGAEDVEVHGQFFSVGVRRGSLQGALKVLALHRLHTLAWPADERWPITSSYGLRVHPILGESRLHNGTDIAMPVGTPIFSAHQGVVKRSGSDLVSGNWLKVTHGFGIESTYCHLEEVGARAGQRVARKQGLGKAGATGRVTGPHLHYVLRVAGTTVDPERYGEAPRRHARGYLDSSTGIKPNLAPLTTTEVEHAPPP